MGALLHGMTAQDGGPWDPSDVRAWLEDAHQFIVAQAQRMEPLSGVLHHGVRWKRTPVEFPSEGRPHLVGADQQALSEVLTQCATVERLMDALQWLSQREPAWSVVEFHPTTSSVPRSAARPLSTSTHHNDLVAVSGRRTAIFEVSDVATTSDGNRKLPKDLASLGVIEIQGRKAVARERVEWDLVERYLVVSAEWHDYLARPRLRPLSVMASGGFKLQSMGLINGHDGYGTGLLRVVPTTLDLEATDAEIAAASAEMLAEHRPTYESLRDS